MSALFHGSRPTRPGSTYAAQSTSNATRGSGAASRWLTRAGLGEFNAGSKRRRRMMQQALPGSHGLCARATKRAAEAALLASVPCLLLRSQVGELVAELLDAAAERIDALLRAGVERVRLARRLELVERKLAAVVHLDGLARLRARAGDEFEAVREIDEADFAIRGVDAFFHGGPLLLAGSHVALERFQRRTFRRTFDSSGRAGAGLAAPSHHVEEVEVVLGRLHLLEDEFHRLDLVHRVE